MAKYEEHIELLPINRTYEEFQSVEYLETYPYIEYDDRLDNRNVRLKKL